MNTEIVITVLQSLVALNNEHNNNNILQYIYYNDAIKPVLLKIVLTPIFKRSLCML